MTYNPKVVPFQRSAAYVHHRALKNLRSNNPVDALELMRRAVERSPDNREYLLDLAEMYCELGLHEQSNRILLDLLAGKDAPAECYFGLALNQFGRNEPESARQALLLYDHYAGQDEYREDADDLQAEMDFCDAFCLPMNRRFSRAEHSAERACEAMREGDAHRACRLFRRSLGLRPERDEMRALYAMALRMEGDETEALRQATISVNKKELDIRAACVAAQVFWYCGKREEAQALVRRAIPLHPMGMELRLMIYALAELEMYAEAAEAVRLALQEAPLDRELLHLRAVTLHLAGAADAEVAGYWLRILRIDPEDSVAAYYHRFAVSGRLAEFDCKLSYEVPDEECRRRMVSIADSLKGGLEGAVARWREDARFRSLLLWAAGGMEESCGKAAVMIIASADDAAAESALRELFYRREIPLSVKMHALVILHLRDADLSRFLPVGGEFSEGMLFDTESLLRSLSVCERQMIRLAADVLEVEFDVHAMSALTLMWCIYRYGLQGGIDPLISAQETAAALAWNYLLQHKVRPSVERLAKAFRCRPRRLVYYARCMAACLERGDTGE